ncbi:MAG: hypothetical protein Q9207_002693 [Kuettlingeria erythrocarpa]
MNIKDASSESVIKHGDLVVLLPFGCRSLFAGLENDGFHPYNAPHHEKDIARALLKSCGIETSTQAAWARLDLFTEDSHGQSLVDNRRPGHIWWPIHLCFVLYPANYPGLADVLEAVANDSFVDPLSEAENWFLGRGAREAAIAAQRKAEEEGRLREKHLAEASVEAQDDDDETSMSHAGRTEQYLSAQEASGIYPTPPDGLAFNTQGPFTTQNPADAPLVGTHLLNSDASENIQGSTIASPVTNVAETHLGKVETQGLFEDMDTDMFDANGLTEADLNFFDEPHTKEDHLELHYESSIVFPARTMSPAEQETLTPMVPSNDTNPTPVPEEDDGGNSDEDQEENDGLAEVLPPSIEGTLGGYGTATSSPEASRSEGSQEGGTRSTTQTEVYQRLQGPGATEEETSVDLTRPLARRDELDEKYRSDGRYAMNLAENVDGSRPGLALRPSKGELPRIGPLLATSDDSSSENTDDGVSEDQSMLSSVKHVDEREDDDGSASSSDLAGQDLASRIVGRASKKRKREPNTTTVDLATPAESAKSPESAVDPESDVPTASGQYLLEYRPGGNLLSIWEDVSTEVSSVLVGETQDFIQIAQLVADQRVLRNGHLDMPTKKGEIPDGLVPSVSSEESSEIVQEMLLTTFPITQHYDLKSLTNLDLEMSAASGSKPKSAAPTVAERIRHAQSQGTKWQGDRIITAQPPFLSVWRGEDATELAAPALYFWEELGLAPCQQRKDIRAFCVYPEHDTIRDAASAFLEAMENSYQSSPQIPYGEPDGVYYVVYMFNPFNDDSMLPHLCAAFLRLYSIYASRLENNGSENTGDLVLQAIPLGFLVNSGCLTIPPPKCYKQLAFEVYSRCRPMDGINDTAPSPFTSGSAIRFAKPIPRTVNFRLTSQPPDGILAGDSSLHLAYSWDMDHQWLACAWIDNLGIKQWSAVYCLQDPDPDFWPAFFATVKEILDTTKDMLQPESRAWKLYLAKDGNLLQTELDGTFPLLHFLTILSIDLDPPISFPPSRPTVSFPTSTTNVDTSPAATTPHEAVFTPDHSSPTTTQTPNRQNYNSPAANPVPGFADYDPSARLIDVVSETWCTISPMPIPDPYLPTSHLAPVCISGYLLKRAGAEDDDGLLPLGVNLVSLNLSKNEVSTKQEQEKVLREVLAMYADLACLARLRGTEEWKRGVLPWHVAAARKSRRAVSGCMRWGHPEGE